MNTDLENDSIAYEGSHRRDGREIFNMDWLDTLEFKEEHGADAEESGYPEKDSERKRKHNQGERDGENVHKPVGETFEHVGSLVGELVG